MNDIVKNSGKVYLIGAGPGDPKLITVKAVDALHASDVIVYDYLVNPEILAYARRGAELVYAGKPAANPTYSQDEINSILIGRALTGQIVARLKGGDPFIFGRGGEEAEALAEAGISWEVIPGVSAGLAAASYAGIPLTHRNYASSVAFITGQESSNRKEKIDWSVVGYMAETLVIFMCSKTITRIARDIIAGGRAPTTPIAIIRWGTYKFQEVYSGTLEELVDIEFMPEPPAIAIIGDVVLLKEKLRWFGLRSLEHSLSSLTVGRKS